MLRGQCTHLYFGIFVTPPPCCPPTCGTDLQSLPRQRVVCGHLRTGRCRPEDWCPILRHAVHTNGACRPAAAADGKLPTVAFGSPPPPRPVAVSGPPPPGGPALCVLLASTHRVTFLSSNIHHPVSAALLTQGKAVTVQQSSTLPDIKAYALTMTTAGSGGGTEMRIVLVKKSGSLPQQVNPEPGKYPTADGVNPPPGLTPVLTTTKTGTPAVVPRCCAMIQTATSTLSAG